MIRFFMAGLEFEADTPAEAMEVHRLVAECVACQRRKRRHKRAMKCRDCIRADMLASVTEGTEPGEPTNALPGTVAKMIVMMERIARGERPHHPKDAKRNQE